VGGGHRESGALGDRSTPAAAEPSPGGLPPGEASGAKPSESSAKLHEPLVKHEKNLGIALRVCLQSCQVVEIQVFEKRYEIHGM